MLNRKISMDLEFKLWVEKLIDNHKNPLVKVTLPYKKLFYTASNDEERNYVEASSQAFSKVMKMECVERRTARSVAEWLPDKRLALVKKRVGIVLNNFGQHDKKYLLPLEVLFLLETNRLELKWNDVPISIQRAYSNLLNTSDCTLLRYIFFKKLVFNGFKVMKAVIPSSNKPGNSGEPPLKKIRTGSNETDDAEEPINIKEQPEERSLRHQDDLVSTEEENKTDISFVDIFKRLQQNGPKSCDIELNRECDYKIVLDTSDNDTTEYNLYINYDRKLDSSLGFCSKNVSKISGVLIDSTDFYSFSKINVPNLF